MGTIIAQKNAFTQSGLQALWVPGNYSPSGRFGARMAIVWYNELAQITKRPNGHLNSTVAGKLRRLSRYGRKAGRLF